MKFDEAKYVLDRIKQNCITGLKKEIEKYYQSKYICIYIKLHNIAKYISTAQNKFFHVLLHMQGLFVKYYYYALFIKNINNSYNAVILLKSKRYV